MPILRAYLAPASSSQVSSSRIPSRRESAHEHIRIAAGIEQSDEPRERLSNTLGQGVFGSGAADAKAVGGSLVHGSNLGDAPAASFSLLAKGIEGDAHQFARQLESLGD